jgi:hypothetical protein
MAQGLYYQHSGRFSVGGVARGLIAGVAAGMPLAFVYAYALAYVPVVGYFSFLLSAAFGGLVGAIAGTGLKLAKTRHLALAAVVGFVATATAFYLSWAVWVYAILRRADADVSLVPLVRAPEQLWAMIRLVNKAGAWSIHGATPTGAVLWTLWGLEAAIILGCGSLIASALVSAPFCEACGAWTQERADAARVAAAAGADDLKRLADNRQIAHLAGFGPPPPEATEWLRLDLHSCQKCTHFHTLDVHRVHVKFEKGKRTEEKTAILENLLVTADEAAALAPVGEPLATAAAPPPGATGVQ